MFGLAVIAAMLNLMLLKFMTMNTDDENRDEIEALEVKINIGRKLKNNKAKLGC